MARKAALEIVRDLVYLLVNAHPSDFPSPAANQFKGFTSRQLRAEFPHLRSRLRLMWSWSYLAATVGTVSAEAVRRYIDTQNGRSWRKGRTR